MQAIGHSIDFPRDEVFVHPESELEFPPKFILFARDDIVTYDNHMTNIGVGYCIARRGGADYPIQHLLANVFVYPQIHEGQLWDSDLDAHWEELMNQIKTVHPEASPSPGLPLPFEGFPSPAEEWLQAHGGRGIILSCRRKWGDRGILETLTHAYLFQTEGWYLKYRISYPKQDWLVTENHITALMREIGMPHGRGS